MKVASIHIYPLKSGRSIDLEAVQVDAWGLEGDRRYMLVDEAGTFVTQRDLPELARVDAKPTDDGLRLRIAGEPAIEVSDTSARIDVDIWGQTVSAALASEQTNATLSRWFGRPLRLVHADLETRRACSEAWAGPGVATGFADGYPILVTATASLGALNDFTRQNGFEAFGMERFRPNIVVETDEPFIEDGWAQLTIGDVILEFVKPCARCIMTTQDQRSGSRSAPDPMPAMRSMRMSADRRVPGVLFGWNAVARTLGKVMTGDPVAVVSRRSELWPFRQRVSS